MAPRGLKALLAKSAPAKLVGSGKKIGFESRASGAKLRGITKQLRDRLWSEGLLPLIARQSDMSIRAQGTWSGKKGGQRRGDRVDKQLSKIINAGKQAAKAQKSMFRLTRMALCALANRGLDPVIAQRSVISEQHKIGTAADIVAYHKDSNRLVVIELKCGYDRGRQAAAVDGGEPCRMRTPCSAASDCNVHRHLAQLCVTRELLAREQETVKKVGDLGIDQTIDGLLMYINDAGAEFYELTEWWREKATRVVQAISA